ncbi:16S rRNA (guanine(966)-N(2))-methyltransferase RsmD [Candidatus Saccharibacteria bacterium]|nr:16S rRNA (guanine(966)-N(2))-methyltransferase RsmD [Candidatus Saccharibacteria bacterium]
MNIRIISGEFGKRKIDAPDGRITHPMGDRQRTALFNIIKAELPDADILDAFAGTGSLGLESLSHGARSAIFIEKDRMAQNILAKNISTLGVENRAKLMRTTVEKWIDGNTEARFDVIFADPPYQDLQLSTVSKLLDLLKPGALMVLSTPGRSEVLAKTGVVVVDNRSYGQANLTFYRREGA